jgi:hypothetical protein
MRLGPFVLSLLMAMNIRHRLYELIRAKRIVAMDRRRLAHTFTVAPTPKFGGSASKSIDGSEISHLWAHIITAAFGEIVSILDRQNAPELAQYLANFEMPGVSFP